MVKKTTKKPATKSVKAKTAEAAQKQTGFDLMTAVLITSLLINLFAVCIWITLRITNMYDAELSELFLAR